MSIGSQLKQARESKGISIPEASAKIKLQAKFIEALEEDNISVFPNGIYAKGFLKKYAQLLGLNQDVLAEQFQGAGLAKVRQEIVLKPKKAAPSKILRHFKKTFIIIISFFIAAGILFLAASFLKTVIKPKKDYKPVKGPAIIKNLNTAAPVRKKQDAVKTAVPAKEKRKPLFSFFKKKQEDTPKQAVLPAGAKGLDKKISMAAPYKSLRDYTGQAGQKPRQVMPLSLSVVARRQCHLTVKVDGKLFFDDFLLEGASENWQADSKFEIGTNDASAIELNLNGKRINLARSGAKKNIIITKDGIQRR